MFVIYGMVKISILIMVKILGIKDKVILLIWVVVWKILINSFIIKFVSNIGKEIIKVIL